jgi:hypothetical protein
LARLIAGGEGSATLTLTAEGAIVATVKGEGSATLTIDGEADGMAFAWLVASAQITVEAEAPPLGVGWVEGTTEDLEGVTPAAIAAQVWNSSAASFNESGTMGNKLNAAGTAGDPWTAQTDDYTTPGTMGYWVKKLLSVGKFLGLK